MSKFQFIILSVFILFIIVGVAAFATYKGSGAGPALPPVTIWGTFPAATFNDYLSSINQTLPQALSVTYVQKDPTAFHDDFIAALARGAGPDAILIPAELLLPEQDKLYLIPYSTVDPRTFQDTYVQEASVYAAPGGLLGLPFTLDPLIMYWNRDLFDQAGVAVYPRFWDEFKGLNQRLTVKDQNGNLRRSALALGDFTNVRNAREILGALLLQAGNPVTAVDANGSVTSALKPSAAADPTAAIQFFTKFVDPNNPDYSWNRGMPDSRSAFLSGLLATYFGFASEIKDLRAKNPNLNFDAAALPQVRSGGARATYARMYGFSLVRSSPNANAAFQTIGILLQPAYLSRLSRTMYIPPVRRDLLAQGSTDPYLVIFDQAALISRTWLDAGPAVSNRIMGDMTTAITSGQKTLTQALEDAGNQYDEALKRATAQ